MAQPGIEIAPPLFERRQLPPHRSAQTLLGIVNTLRATRQIAMEQDSGPVDRLFVQPAREGRETEPSELYRAQSLRFNAIQ